MRLMHATLDAPPAIQREIHLTSPGGYDSAADFSHRTQLQPRQSSSGQTPPEILLIEDNPGDVRLIQEAFAEAQIPHTLRVATDGDEAMLILHDAGLMGAFPRPDLVLLDLDLPRKDGRQVLAEMKQDERLKRIPVIVLTSSNAPRDVRACYDHRANCYVRKPMNFDEFVATVKSIENFWLNAAVLPAA